MTPFPYSFTGRIEPRADDLEVQHVTFDNRTPERPHYLATERLNCPATEDQIANAYAEAARRSVLAALQARKDEE